MEDKMIAIPLEEYKELLVIKGKYEEYANSKLQMKSLNWNGYKEDDTTILPQREFKTGDSIPCPPYKITC